MSPDRDPAAGLIETYETAIAELESWNDPATAKLLEALRVLRQRALEHGHATERQYALHP